MPIKNNMPIFVGTTTQNGELALAMMAADIERLAKMTAPVRTGALYQSIRNMRIAPGHWRVTVGDDSTSNKYAAYQEFGQRRDGSYVVRRYTKSGTGDHFLENAGANVAMHAPGTFRTVMATKGRGLL
jgi:hypothetical protein